MLFTLRHRPTIGVRDDLVEAKDLAEAEAIGRAYCIRELSKYIGIRKAVVATVAILDQAAPSKSARIGA